MKNGARVEAWIVWKVRDMKTKKICMPDSDGAFSSSNLVENALYFMKINNALLY